MSGAFGTLVNGGLLSWLTPWGFFKHKWVIYLWAIVVIDGLIVFILGDPAIRKLATLAEAEGLSALQNPEYISAWNGLIIVGIVNSLLLISAAFVSVLKPWRKHKEAETTA